MDKLIFATGNAGKMKEIREILGRPGLTILSQKEAGITSDAEENGTTFEANALIKARAVAAQTDALVLADDSGLEIDYLNGEPGVYSARYGHKNSDAERIEYLLSNLKDVPAEQRTAKFVCVITCLWPDGRKIVARGECPGEILFAPQGTGGFGYDPVFFLPELGKTYAELTPAEKNAISHRARALQAFCRIYQEELEHDDK